VKDSKKLDGKRVRFIAIDPKYAKSPYPAIAPESASMGTYVTGQHIDPNDPNTHANLSKGEMLGLEEIKPAARKALWPYVINPENQVMIMHGKWYDCRLNDKGRPLNPKDYAEAYFIIEQDIVAENKDVARKEKHKFFLEDKEAEAKNRIDKADAVYEAEKLIRETLNVSEYKKVIQILNLRTIQFNQPTEGLTETRMKDILISEAHSNPGIILNVMSEDSKMYFYIIDLVNAGIIKKQRDGFYEGKTFLATNLEGMRAYISNKGNVDRREKWNRLLRANDKSSSSDDKMV
jgi:hypothetical protein